MRDSWVYAPDGGGRFVRVAGGNWAQAAAGVASVSVFARVAETADYVELRGVNVGVSVRLYDGHFEASFDGGLTWLREYAGAWGLPADDLARAVNDARAARGLPPLAANEPLTASAIGHAAWMDRNNKMSHYEPGNDWMTRARAAGYPAWRGVNECIADGQRTAADVVADWMDDPPHREAVLGAYASCGVGRSGPYWCADFGGV